MQVYLRRPRGPVVTTVSGIQMELRPSEYVERWLLFAPQFYEHGELRFVRRRLRDGDVFVDIGAHIGLYSLIASCVVGERGRVIAVEADPVTAAILRRNVGRNGGRNIEVIEAGVSDREETLRLGASVGNLAGNSFLFPRSTGVEVACLPLVDLVRARGVGRIAGAKLDIEGFEHRVLSAYLASVPAEGWPRWLIVEFHPDLLERAGGNTLELLRAHGYTERERHDTNHIFELG